MIEITQFERRTQSVPTGTEPMKGKVNAGKVNVGFLIDLSDG
jgi:hypothetical protein